MDRPDSWSRRSGMADAEQSAEERAAVGEGCEESAWANRLPSNAVAVAISRREHEVVAELPPLFESVDSDALDAFLRSSPGANATFTHCGYEVTVTGRGTVELTPINEP